MPLTMLQAHCERWKDGCGAKECHFRNTRRVLLRGRFPCDVLFVGEAPGESENVLGVPFVGPAGKLQDHIVDEALGDLGLSWAFGNVVGCVPREEDGSKATEPSLDQVEACKPRLEDLIRVASPRLIVRLGKVSQDWLEQGVKGCVVVPPGVAFCDVFHPAYIVRAVSAQQSFLIRKAIVTVRSAAKKLLPNVG